jgi:ribulose-5-phosphate 4-epimerase/fuculose-1-phosphate aldolase
LANMKSVLDVPGRNVALASRILAGEGILDAYGHVSCRHPEQANRFFISRALAPALVTSEDVVELDLDGNDVNATGCHLFLERYIHSAIYAARPDAHAIVHSHARAVLPFAAVPEARMQAICHMCGFLADSPPPFEIADHAGDSSDMLIGSADLGQCLARHLGGSAVVLMRGHGYTVVGQTIQEATYRAIYTSVNCELDLSSRLLGTPRYLSAGEAKAADRSAMTQIHRPWEMWCRTHAADLLT